MRLKEPDKLTPGEYMKTLDVEKSYRLAWDCNASEAEKFFKELPWAACIITPKRVFFRE